MKIKSVVVGALGVLLAGAMVYLYGGHQAPSGQPPLEDLTPQNVEKLKDGFNAAKGNVRLILLLSPT
jgi:hypothetical protein